jgi:hypothetical protein
VDEAARVRRVERRAGLGDELRGERRLERALLVEHPAQVRSIHEPHRDEQELAVLAGLVDGDHVRVVERGRDPRLAREPGAEGLVARELGRDQLERDGPVEGELARAVYDAHAAAPGLCLDPVAGDARAEHR